MQDNTPRHQNILTLTILMLSLVTVMTGAALSPALGQIKAYYSAVHPVFIQMILSLPALFIILVNISFRFISKRFTSKTIAITGLSLYVVSGVSGGLAHNIYILLLTRATIGIGTGLIMPLSTGLLGYYFSKDKQGQLMGYSSAMNNIGGIIGMSLSGLLASISWRYSFNVYFIGLIVLILVILFLPSVSMHSKDNFITFADIKPHLFPFLCMFLTQVIFYLYITNFAMISGTNNIFSTSKMGIAMSAQTIGALITSLLFSRIKILLKHMLKYVSVFFFGLSYFLLAEQNSQILTELALFLNGIGFGLLVPYFNVLVIHHSNKEKAVGLMAIMSMSLYLGQFSSPLILSLIRQIFGVEALKFPYYLGVILSLGLLLLLSFIRFTRDHEAS